MATLTREVLGESGLDATYVAASGGGDQVDNSDGRTVLHVKNGGGGSITVTVAEQLSGSTIQDPSYGTLSKSDATLVITAGDEGFFGPFKKGAFNDTSQYIQITYSGVTSVTIAALKFP